MPPGHHCCPECLSRERSFSVWEENGLRHGYCHRASCGAALTVAVWGSSGSGENTAPTPSPSVLRPYTGDRVPLRESDRLFLREQYGFMPHCQTVGYTTPYGAQPFIFPILAPNGSERGVLEMKVSPKYRRIWKAKEEPMISWTPAYSRGADTIWIVEDVVSAAKLWGFAPVRAVALLGTHMTQDAAAEIQRHAQHVVIALDADATGKAFLMARRWGAAFKSCQVQILTHDIKDLSVDEIQALVARSQA